MKRILLILVMISGYCLMQKTFGMVTDQLREKVATFNRDNCDFSKTIDLLVQVSPQLQRIAPESRLEFCNRLFSQEERTFLSSLKYPQKGQTILDVLKGEQSISHWLYCLKIFEKLPVVCQQELISYIRGEIMFYSTVLPFRFFQLDDEAQLKAVNIIDSCEYEDCVRYRLDDMKKTLHEYCPMQVTIEDKKSSSDDWIYSSGQRCRAKKEDDHIVIEMYPSKPLNGNDRVSRIRNLIGRITSDIFNRPSLVTNIPTEGKVNHVSWSHDEMLLALLFEDRVAIYSVTGEQKYCLQLQKPADYTSWDPHGNYLLVRGEDYLKIWNLFLNKTYEHAFHKHGRIKHLQERVLFVDNSQYGMIDTHACHLLYSMAIQYADFADVVVHKNAGLVALGRKIIDLGTGKIIFEIMDQGMRVWGNRTLPPRYCGFSSDGSRIFYIADDPNQDGFVNLRILNLRTGQKNNEMTFDRHSGVALSERGYFALYKNNGISFYQITENACVTLGHLAQRNDFGQAWSQFSESEPTLVNFHDHIWQVINFEACCQLEAEWQLMNTRQKLLVGALMRYNMPDHLTDSVKSQFVELPQTTRRVILNRVYEKDITSWLKLLWAINTKGS